MVAPSHEHYYWPMKIGRTAWWSSIALLWLMAFPRLGAQTDEIQVYTGEVETPGKANLTIHANYTPSGRTVAEFPGGVVPRRSVNGAFEWAYGVSDWFEAGEVARAVRGASRGDEKFFLRRELRAELQCKALGPIAK